MTRWPKTLFRCRVVLVLAQVLMLILSSLEAILSARLQRILCGDLLRSGPRVHFREGQLLLRSTARLVGFQQ